MLLPALCPLRAPSLPGLEGGLPEVLGGQGATAVAVVAAISLALWVRRAARLAALGRAAGRLAEGDYRTPVLVRGGGGRMGALAAALEHAREEMGRDFSLRSELYRELERARAEATAAERSKERFVANVSHEVRTPLNGMVGMLELLAEGGGLSAEQEDTVRAARDSAKALLAHLNDVLRLVRASAASSDTRAVFDAAAVLEEVRALLAPEAARRDVELSLERGELPPRALGQATTLRQALLLLGIHAVRSGPSARVRISARGARRDAAWCVSFEVAGLGAASDVEWQPCIERVRSMGAELAFTGPDDDLVARFELVLPEAPDAALPHTGGSRAAPLPAGSRVLVVDDHPINQRITVRFLEKLGYEARVAGDGREALRAFAEDPPDAVLMDCQMPGMDGFEATRRLRALDERGRRVLIVGLSAGAIDGDRQKALDAGMDEYLEKPVRLDVLAAALQSVPSPAAVSSSAPRAT